MFTTGAAGLVGNTPLVHLPRLSKDLGVELLVKLEGRNPAGSVKDRVALAMVEAAEAEGRLKPGSTIVEPTSGNTGIALAMIAAARSYRLVLSMPEAMSEERVSMLRALGAEVVLTTGTLMRDAVTQAELLGTTTPDAILLRQFENPANPRVHERTTAEEIWHDCEGHVDVFVAGIGTGGTITGVSRVLKKRSPDVISIGVEPAAAAILSGRPVGAHRIQGLGAGFVPPLLERDLVDRFEVVDDDESVDALRRLARTEGLSAGLSSGAALAATIRCAPQWQGKRVVVVLPDSGDRYLSTPLFKSVGA